MLKLTLKNDYGAYSVSEKGTDITLNELLPLLEQLLKASGYHYDGKLEIVDEDG